MCSIKQRYLNIKKFKEHDHTLIKLRSSYINIAIGFSKGKHIVTRRSRSRLIQAQEP
jgi:hypothetical protein